MGMVADINLDWSLIKWVVVIVACAVAAITDIQSRRIPNALTIPLFFTGIIAAFAFRGSWGALESFIAAMLLMTPYLLLFLFAGGGAGDAKLMAGIGAWLGLISGMAALLAVAITGVVMALWWARKFGSRSESGQIMMPYGVAIGFGVCLAALGVSLWQSIGVEAVA